MPAPKPGYPAALWTIVAAAVAARVAAALYLGDTVVPMPGVFDQVSYHTLAIRVMEGHGFTFATGWWPATPANHPTAHWSFLYVLLLAATYALFGAHAVVARVAQAVAVGILQPVLTYRIAARLFGHRVGLVSAGVSAGYAYFVYYAGALVTESLCIVAVLWTVDTAMRVAEAAERPGRRVGLSLWMQLGLAIAAAALLRQVTLLLSPVILGWVWWRLAAQPSGHPWRQRLSPIPGIAVVVLVVVAAVLPWTVRNYRAFDEIVLLNTNAGFAFFWGNHPIHGTRFTPILPSDTYGRLIPDELRPLNEAQLDRALLRRGMAFIAADPVRFLKLSFSRIEEYVRFWPSAESGRLSNYSRVLSFGICLPFILLGLVAALRGPSPGEANQDQVRAGVGLIVALACAYSLIHFLTWTLVRYRLPVDALLIPFAGLSMVQCYDVFCRGFRFRGWPRSTGASA